jgi:hypothetical protein
MSETPELDDFEDDEAILEGDDADLERGNKELDRARRPSGKSGAAALRRLEQLMEQKRTAELTSDFEDYDLDEPIVRSASRTSRR